MSSHPGNGGLPRGPSRALPPLTGTAAEDGRKLNEQKVEKLRTNSLRQRARRFGLELRHSTNGYALIDRAGNRIDDRNDMTLNEIEARLPAPP